jgi:putative ABC transport system substrate-binding protein
MWCRVTKTHTVFALLAMASMVQFSPAAGQEPKSQPKIGIVYTAPHPLMNEVIAGFKDVVTKAKPNASFFERHAEGRPEQYGTAVLATIAANPDLLAPITTPITKIAVEQARERIPIVFMGVTDPVGAGVVRSIQNPELSTGSSDLCPFASLLDISRQLLPNAKTIGLPYNPSDQPAVFGRSQLIELAPKYGFQVIDRQVTSASELPTVVRGLAGQVDAVIIAADNLMMENPAAVVSSALAAGKPTLACDSTSVKSGAVAGVSVNYRQVGELAGQRAVEVLNGKPAGSLPVAVLDSGGIAINLKAACQARIELPKQLVAKAADVIEPDFRCDGLAMPLWWAALGLIAVTVSFVLFLWGRRRKKIVHSHDSGPSP